jgi:hypothetical protein
MRILTHIQTLEFYDVPQILTAVDAMGTNYLCTLFQGDEGTDDAYKYLGVQISEPRLMAFVGGQLDLRDAYVHPEVDGALYVVEAKKEMLTATKPLESKDLTEDMLPEAGYYYDTKNWSEEAKNGIDTYELQIPANDRVTFSTIISRMGWKASSLRKVMEKIAVL